MFKEQIREIVISDNVHASMMNPIIQDLLCNTMENRSAKIDEILQNGTQVTFKANGIVRGVISTTGRSLEYEWNGTELGVRQEGGSEYQFVNLKGEKGDVGEQGPIGDTGPQGDKGDGLHIDGLANSVEDLPLGESTGACYLVGTNLYYFNGTIWDDAGSIQGPQGKQGIQGEKGDTGNTGEQGIPGPNNIANNLETTDVNYALAAPQGKLLNEQITVLYDRKDINAYDMRGYTTRPTDYIGKLKTIGLISASNFGINENNGWMQGFGLCGYKDVTGGAYELAFSESQKIFYRCKDNNNEWLQAKQLATTDKLDISSRLKNLWVLNGNSNGTISKSGDSVTINIRIKDGVVTQHTTIISIPEWKPSITQPIKLNSPSTAQAIGVANISTSGDLTIWSLSTNVDVWVSGVYTI